MNEIAFIILIVGVGFFAGLTVGCLKKPVERKDIPNEREFLAAHFYHVYCKAVGGVAFNGDPLPEWYEFARDPVKRKQVAGWRAVAECLPAELLEIAAERSRQIMGHGYDAVHDDRHTGGELAKAAAVYATGSSSLWPGEFDWPWDINSYKPTTREDDLIKAGALIVAELERVRRLSATLS